MDGDFAPLVELVALRKKYNFLLVIDDVSFLNHIVIVVTVGVISL